MKDYLTIIGMVVLLAALGLAGKYTLQIHDSAVYLRGYDNGYSWGQRTIRAEANDLNLGHWEFDHHGEPEFIFNGERQ